MTVWICSYPRSGNSLVASRLLRDGRYCYLNDGNGGVSRAIAARLLTSHPDAEPLIKIHDLDLGLARARLGERVCVPIRDGRDVLVSYAHHANTEPSKMIALWAGLATNRHRWDDWMRQLRESGDGGGPDTCSRYETWRFEQFAGDGFAELHDAAPLHFRAGRVGQWRDLPSAEREYLQNELGPELERWGYQ